MWSTKTADLWYTEPNATYHPIVSPIGQLIIRDNKNRVIWQSFNNVNVFSGPFVLAVMDQGDAIITNSNGTLVWQTQPVYVKDISLFALVRSFESWLH